MDVLEKSGTPITATGLEGFLASQRAASVPETRSSEPAAGTETTESGKTEKKEKTVDELKKELSAQAKASLRLGAERAELQRQLDAQKKVNEELQAKAAGTFVEPTKDQQERESVLKAEFAKYEARRESSKLEAIKEFGEEAVLSKIYVDDAPFASLATEKPWLVQRVIAAEKPIHEMLTILAEEELLAKFGRTEAALLAKAEELLKPKLFEQFKTELKDHGEVKPAVVVPSLTRAKGAGSDSRTGGEPVRSFSALTLNPHNRI